MLNPKAHAASTAKVQKKIIADCLSIDGRARVEGWLPRYMQFPTGGYTGRFVGEEAMAATVADESRDTDTGIDDSIAEAA